MSKRRQAGEWVRCKPNAGFVGDSNRLRAQIQPEEDKYWQPCFGLNGCVDPACREWATLWTEPDPESNGESHMLCHVSECEMEDAQPPE